MNYLKLLKLKNKLYFTIEDAAAVFDIKPASAYVLCSRYVKKGIFIRLKKNFYILQQNWEVLSDENFFKLSNFLQVPSYISFMTALSAYEVTTQVLRNFYESACIKRSVKFEQGQACFNYYKIKRKYYFSFEKKNGFFIATKEKAFVDMMYLYSFGKYKADLNSINIDALNKDKILEIVKVFPLKTKNAVKRICKI